VSFSQQLRVRSACGLVGFAAAIVFLNPPSCAQSPSGVSSSVVSTSESSVAAGSASVARASTAGRVLVLKRDQQHVDLYVGPGRPFSSVAVEAEIGTFGIGAEVATPLSRSFNLRGGAEFLNFGYDFAVDAAQYASQAHLRSGHVGVDIQPMGGEFRISPQLLLFQSAFAASVYMEGGKVFELGNMNYLSSATDPVHGGAAITMGRRVMPALTVGWGNMLARHSRHWSVPFEFGVAYTGHYTMTLNLSGTACLNYVNCMSTSSAQVQQSVHQEETDLNETMKHFQIYPIANAGFAYRF
jgi:hypothetical protein